MDINDIVLWKGKPARIFGKGTSDGEVFQFSIMMLNNRQDAAILNVSPKSKHLEAIPGFTLDEFCWKHDSMYHITGGWDCVKCWLGQHSSEAQIGVNGK